MQIQACLGYAERQEGRQKAIPEGGEEVHSSLLIPHSSFPINSPPVYRGSVRRTRGFIPNSQFPIPNSQFSIPHSSLNQVSRIRCQIYCTKISIEIFEMPRNCHHRGIIGRKRKFRDIYLNLMATTIIDKCLAQSRVG